MAEANDNKKKSRLGLGLAFGLAAGALAGAIIGLSRKRSLMDSGWNRRRDSLRARLRPGCRQQKITFNASNRLSSVSSYPHKIRKWVGRHYFRATLPGVKAETSAEEP